VGALLRKWREERKIKSKDAAAHIRVDATTLGRIERGEHGVNREKISTLMGLFEIEDAAALNELVRSATEDPSQQWWHPYRHQITPEYLDFIALEAQAISIRASSSLAIPGLLQCPAYAQEMQETATFAGLDELADTYQSVRLSRQQVITRSTRSARVEAVFSEAALLVGQASMKEQINHLIALGRRPNVDIRVVKLSAPLTTHSIATFEVLGFCHPWKPVVHLDSSFGGMLEDDAASVTRMEETFAFMQQYALPADKTREFLEARLEEID
jgi:transcriptional regulator with XRE-family HTH domain